MSWLAAHPWVLVLGLLAAGAAGALWLRRRQEANGADVKATDPTADAATLWAYGP